MSRASAAAPTVSVILPTFNRADLLPRAISSVLDQSYDDMELIVVDDASADGTEVVVHSFDDPRIRYLSHDTNRGGAAARNTALAAARGRFVAFQDSDDEWLPGRLEQTVHALEASGADVAYASCLRRMPHEERTLPGRVRGPREGDLRVSLLWRNVVPMAAATARTDVVRAAGGFDASLPRLQDWDLWLRIADHARFVHVDHVLAVQHVQEASVSGDFTVYAQAMERFLDKHAKRFEGHRRALAHNRRKIGVRTALHVSPKEGRRHLRAAWRRTPWSLVPPFWIAASCLGLPRLRRLLVGLRRTGGRRP